MPVETVDSFVRTLHERGVGAARVIGRVIGEFAGGRIKAVINNSPNGMSRQVEDTTMVESTTTTSACCCGTGAAAGGQAASLPAGLPAAAGGEALKAYLAAVNAPGALDVKYKKLISLALSIVCKCGPCVKLNAKAACEAGATDAEIAEAAALGIAFGGSSAMMFYNTVRGG
jgi:AhpD family alkylhydroperoxidase